MAEKCDLLSACGFFKKYQNINKVACENLIRIYCLGTKMDQCKRRQYRLEHGEPPHEDMMPSGTMAQ